jgi:hypothetical protein
MEQSDFVLSYEEINAVANLFAQKMWITYEQYLAISAHIKEMQEPKQPNTHLHWQAVRDGL